MIDHKHTHTHTHKHVRQPDVSIEIAVIISLADACDEQRFLRKHSQMMTELVSSSGTFKVHLCVNLSVNL